MRHEFRLADIGEGLEEAEIISWLVQVGDQVSRDQPLIEVMTDKSNAELPAPAAGTVIELSGAVGDILTVGELIAVIEEEADTATTPSSRSATPAEASPEAPDHHDAVSPAAQAPTVDSEPALAPIAARPKASPSTRKAAAARGIDLARVAGTGPGGRILLTDLDNPLAPVQQPSPPAPAEPAPPPPPAAVETIAEPAEPSPAAATTEPNAPTANLAADSPSGTVPLRGIRRAVAFNMAQSWAEIPHIHAFDHIDAEPLLGFRERLKASDQTAYQQATPLTFFVAAVAKALREQPQANASLDLDDETITYHRDVNVGVAVATDNGLVVPVLRGADRLDFATLSRTLSALVRGARSGELSRDHFLGGTVTITNFGALGGEQAVPLIRPPESLIVGFGSIEPRPFVIDGHVVARKTMHTVVGADHRLLDGDVTTEILTSIRTSLTDPLRFVLSP